PALLPLRREKGAVTKHGCRKITPISSAQARTSSPRSLTCMADHGGGGDAGASGGEALEEAGGFAGGAEAGVGDFVDGVIDEGEGEGDEGDAGAGGDEGPPGSG